MPDEFLIKNFEDLDRFADKFVNFISTKHKESAEKAIVVGLSGDLGAGKTTFSKKYAEKLGIFENVTSPTFVIQKGYKIPENSPLSGIFTDFVHIDAYRLESSKELEVLGWSKLLASPRTLIFIEWPEKVEDILPTDSIKIKFDFIDDTTRRVSHSHDM